MLAFGSGGCVGGLETVGVARADRWNATYRFTSTHAIATAVNFDKAAEAVAVASSGSGQPVQVIACPTGNLAEGANIWWDGK